MNYEIVKSDLLRGLSAFDSLVVLESPEYVYTTAIEKLSSHFVLVGLISSNDKVLAVSQYRSFVTKIRSNHMPEYDDWIQFNLTHYEIQCRRELLRLFRLSCLSLAPVFDVPPSFDVPVLDLKSYRSLFQSCIVSLQISYQTVPHVSNLFRDTKVISHVFRMLGRGDEIISDKNFSIWNFLKGSSSRRVSLQGKMETGYRLYYDLRDLWYLLLQPFPV